MPTLILPRRANIVSPTSIVQLEYSPEPLPKPSSTQVWTRFVLLSDTHAARTFPVPAGDVLLHSGDLTRRGTLRELRHTMEWLYALPHPVKIIIAGNRDFSLDREWYDANWARTARHDEVAIWEPPDTLAELLTGPRAVAANIVYLHDEQYKFRARPGGREWSVYGSPQSPNFGARVRAFGYDAADAEAVVSQFPSTDILMTHGPPHEVLDLTTKAAHAGCPALAARLHALRPRLHAFGHIHEARGAYVHLWDRTDGLGAQVVDGAREEAVVGAGPQTIFVNAANWPSGPNAVKDGEKVGIGGLGVQPIVVDLLE
ncbi:Metallo-dependent phosphatase-like protein [Mycena maculata]|uniref:Metallo-dependent phosphatase-like protein n=1 Tax=Mycena maculata TaxID=230809 RepID=A0AAD7HE72_9AGAR|nr:Metallo-dependent phosphatase-like protein [Mycena maculata]